MAWTVVWTEPALEDVDAITLFIARDSPHYAVRMVEDFFRIADELQRFPRSGRVVSEVKKDDIRERVLGNYRLIYQVGAVTVNILAVIHARRDLAAHLDRSDPT